MAKFQNHEDYWKPCRPGTILNASSSKCLRDRRNFLIRSAMAGVLTATGIFSSLFMLIHKKNEITVAEIPEGLEENPFTKIRYPVELRCEEVERLRDQFVDAIRTRESQRSHEQDELIEDVHLHNQVCIECNKMIQNALLHS